MKLQLHRLTPWILVWAGVMAATRVSAQVAATPPAVSPISIKVNVLGDTDYKNLSSSSRESGTAKRSRMAVTPPREATQNRRLEISLQNLTSRSFENLTVKYYLFVQDLEADRIEMLHSGQKNASLPPIGRAKLESESAKTNFEPAHPELNGSGNKRSASGKKATTVEATGKQYKGYGVQVLDGGTVLVEKFEPAELKDKLGSAQANDKPARKKKKD